MLSSLLLPNPTSQTYFMFLFKLLHLLLSFLLISIQVCISLNNFAPQFASLKTHVYKAFLLAFQLSFKLLRTTSFISGSHLHACYLYGFLLKTIFYGLVMGMMPSEIEIVSHICTWGILFLSVYRAPAIIVL